MNEILSTYNDSRRCAIRPIPAPEPDIGGDPARFMRGIELKSLAYKHAIQEDTRAESKPVELILIMLIRIIGMPLRIIRNMSNMAV